MRKSSSPGIEGVVERVVVEIRDGRHVDICEAVETATEVGRVVVCTEDTTESLVTHHLQRVPAGRKEEIKCILSN